MKMMDFLSNFNAESIDTQPIYDRMERGNDKLRVLFEIQNKENAKAIYDMIGVHRQNLLPQSQQFMQIYYLLPEKKFEEYADVAAEKYYAEEAQKRQEDEAKRKAEKEANGGNKRGNKGGRGNKRGFNDDVSGIKFGNQPPKFTSTKSKEFPQTNQAATADANNEDNATSSQ